MIEFDDVECFNEVDYRFNYMNSNASVITPTSAFFEISPPGGPAVTYEYGVDVNFVTDPDDATYFKVTVYLASPGNWPIRIYCTGNYRGSSSGIQKVKVPTVS